MSSFPGSPHLVKGGLVQINASTAKVERIITLQYNPDSLTRSLQPQTITGEGQDRSQALRLLGPPVETIKLEAEIDAADYMESAGNTVASVGIQPQLAALEMIIYPSSAAMLTNNMLSNLGTLEIFPMESPLTLFIWNKHRIIPVRFTDYSVTEEAFDVNLNPLRAKVSIGMRVLSVDDLGFDHKGGSLFMCYQQNKEKLAGMFASGSLQQLGINAIP
ncbi:hypothetical protein SAMN05421788_107262 [Filimonas lacunae]|uniref:Uncharacterized protein n=1 Tax=Filimonas lacunae TaxID=477680 RepID=A0A173MGP7_9BACT|nr:hypothetical protein [Filimonas lacunae]BAV06601.1 hypothetical protein FLA_2620 [Filimonas lacunae]SIT27539.1 hypothetical protein SAMN05421788_107262 [Filimonas lacunae]